MISTASLTTVFLLAVTASAQNEDTNPYEKFVQGDASAFALMADWSTVFTKWQFVTPADNTDYVTTTFTDLTPCMLTCQRDDVTKKMQCTDSYRQTSIDLIQMELSEQGAVTPLECTITELQTTTGLQCEASSIDHFLQIAVTMVKKDALPQLRSVNCSPEAIAKGVEITCTTTYSQITKLSSFFNGIASQMTDKKTIIFTWDTFQDGTNTILTLVTLKNGNLHYFTFTVDADLIYTVCDVQIGPDEGSTKRNLIFRITTSSQGVSKIDGGTYRVNGVEGEFAGNLLSVPTALLTDGINKIMISVSVTCGGSEVELKKGAFLIVSQSETLIHLIFGPPSEPEPGDTFLVRISVRGEGVEFVMMVEAKGAQTITRWSCTLRGQETQQPDNSEIRFNRDVLQKGKNVIVVVVTGSDGDIETRDFIIHYQHYIPSTKLCRATCAAPALSDGVNVHCSSGIDTIASVKYSINDDGNQVEVPKSTFVITNQVAWRKQSNTLQLIAVCDNTVESEQQNYMIDLIPPDPQCQVMYSPCNIADGVTISCRHTTTADNTKSCNLDGNQYTTQCRLSNVIQYETLTLGSHTFTVGMTDVYGLTGKSEVAFFVKFEIWCTGACNFDTKSVLVSCESTYPVSSWTVSVNGETPKDCQKLCDVDVTNMDLTNDLTLEVEATNTRSESATDIIFLRGQLLL